MQIHTCRLCSKSPRFSISDRRQTFRYGIRHWAHAECGLAKWGAQFVEMIPRYQVGQLPALYMQENYPAAYDRALEISNVFDD